LKTNVIIHPATILLATFTVGFGQPTVQFASNIFSVNEAAGAVTLAISRQGDTNPAVTVDYATADGTATNGLKYTAVTGTLAFGSGETNQTVVVPILNDGLADGTKTFQVILSNPTNAVLGSSANTTVLVADNDTGIQFRFATYLVAEDAGAIRIGVVRDDDGEVPVAVDYTTSDLSATSGVDYTGLTNALAFAPTERLKFFNVPILNNTVQQSSRLFRLTLSNPTGGSLGVTKTTTVAIKDNDQGFQFETNNYFVAEDAGAVLIHVLRGTDDTNSSATVDIATTDATATNGLDYNGTTNTLMFAPGEQVKAISLPILNDGIKEGTKTFSITLSNPTGGALLSTSTTTTVSILDNDPGLGIELSSSPVWAGAGGLTLAVVRGNDGALGPITVDYATADGTAQAGRDYEAISGALTFQENETVKSLTIPILPGAAAGGSGTFSVTLNNPTGGVTLGTATSTVIIQKNYCAVAPPFDSQLAIRRDGGVNVLTWTGGGKLQRTDRVTGPWQTLTATQGTYSVRPPAPATFYRVTQPRPVNLYIPSSYDGYTPMPLVILLHGYSWTGDDQEAYMHLQPLAESRGFLYCHPNGLLNAHGEKPWNQWDEQRDPNVELGWPYVDDVAYLRRLIDEVGRHFAVDPRRIYLIGHSGGGCMAYFMALKSADLIAGIADLAGYLTFDFNQTAPSEPVNILHINGTADSVASYWGGAITIDKGFWVNLTPFPSVMRTMQTWAGYNGASDPVADPAPTLDLTTDLAGLDTVIMRYTTAPPGGAVELWTINNGGHVPTLSSRFSPQVIDWLLTHPKP